MKVFFISDLDVRHIDDNKWRLLHDYFVSIEVKDKIYLLHVPASFTTDFCSVPRLPFAYLLLGGIAQHAGLMHDALYSAFPNIQMRDITEQMPFIYSRAWADKMFLIGLKKLGVNLIKRQLMYWAVRSHGWRYFKKRPDDRRK